MPFASKQKQREYQREYQRNRRKQGRRRTQEPDYGEPRISPETKIAILVTIFFAAGALSLLSFFDLAGPLGQYVKSALSLSFGWGALLFPVVLFLSGFVLLKGLRYALDRTRLAGIAILFAALLGVLHHLPSFEEPARAIAEGRGGGYVGLALSSPAVSVAGYWGAWVLLLGLAAVGALLTFSTVFFGIREEESEEVPAVPAEGVAEEVESPSLFGRMLERLAVWRYDREFRAGESADSAPPAEEPSDAPLQSAEEAEGADSREEPVPIVAPKVRRSIKIPLDLLESGKEKPSADDIDATKEKIERTLATFGIRVEMGDVSVGPTITQYTLKPADGVKLARITALANDLALSLAAHPLRIEAPIPGRSLVGIEVPNRATATVKLKDILASSAFKNRPSNLSIGLGKDVAGKSWVVDLERMPHLLIAGSTGSGKSVAINSLIVSLLYQNSPDDLKIVLVDPKKVELSMYNDIPYLLTPVITDVKKTVNALKWVVSEMERRYQVLSNRGKRNIAAYNAANAADTLPYIVFIIDELADLMSVAAGEVEAAIVRLAQMSRAVGIHLVLATQRPSVNVLTGLIKANVPSRIAFSVPSQIDSRTILDMAGAERLLGRGDMLFVSPELGKPRRLQGAFLSDAEIERVTGFLKEQGEVEYADAVVAAPSRGADGVFGGEEGGYDDELYDDAKSAVLSAGKASASLLQRRLRIGYARAARLLDLLEAEGVVGPADGARPREILASDVRGEELADNEETV